MLYYYNIILRSETLGWLGISLGGLLYIDELELILLTHSTHTLLCVSLLIAHLRVLAKKRRGEVQLGKRIWLVEILAWRVCAR